MKSPNHIAALRIAGLAVLLMAARPALAQPSAPQPAPPAQPAPQPVQARSMGLGELLAVAIRQEASLARATIDVRIADAAVLEAAGIDDWLLAVGGSWSSSREEAIVNGQFGYYTRNSIALDADLSRSLPTGGTVRLHASTGRTSAEDTTLYGDSVSAIFSQPLWRGRGSAIARAAQEQARIVRDAAVLERESVAIDAVQQLITAYWNLVQAWRSLEIRRGTLLLAEEQLRNTRARIQAGAVAPTEALAVQQTIARREEEILNAELAITESSLALRRLAGLDVGAGDVDLLVQASLAVAPRPFDTDALLARALERNPALIALQVRQETLAVDLRLAEDALDPALDLDISVGSEGAGTSAGEALKEVPTLDALTFRAGLTYRQALGKRAARGRYQAVREQLARYQVDRAEIRAQLARDLVRAIKQAEIAQKRAMIGQQVIDLAEQNIEAEKARFVLGRATNFDVLQRQEELQQAQLNQAQAILEYLQAVTVIDALTGDLLVRYGIALDPAAEAPAGPGASPAAAPASR